MGAGRAILVSIQDAGLAAEAEGGGEETERVAERLRRSHGRSCDKLEAGRAEEQLKEEKCTFVFSTADLSGLQEQNLS